MKPTNHKAVGGPAGSGRPSGGLGDGEASVKKWMKVLDTALNKKNPPAVVFQAADGAPAARLELTIAEYDDDAAGGTPADD